MDLDLNPRGTEQEMAAAAHFLFELISVHGPEAIELAERTGLEAILLLHDEIRCRIACLAQLAEGAPEGRLRNAVFAFLRAKHDWEGLVQSGLTSFEADRRVRFFDATKALRAELSTWK